jgi:hypothetical protein
MGCTADVKAPAGSTPAAPGEPGAAPGNAAGDGAAPGEPGCAPPPVRIWKLTPAQYGRTIEGLLPGLKASIVDLEKTATSVGAFKNYAASGDISEPEFDVLFVKASELARQVAARAGEIDGCAASQPVTPECASQVTSRFAERAFRRPLEGQELTAYAAFFAAQSQTGSGLEQVFRAILLSPHFLYRTELGTAPTVTGQPTSLTPFERASALSYLISEGPPDAELYAAASAGGLATAAEIEAHARRLLATPEGTRGLVNFFAEQLETDRVLDVRKPEHLSEWTPELAADLAAETRRFVEHTLFASGGALPGLFLGTSSFVNDRIAALYGMSGSFGAELSLTPLPPGRMGLLGQASILSSFALEDLGDVVRRGRFIRERLLCQGIPAPPPDLANVVIPTKPDGKHTQREQLAVHSADARCSGCHALMDPLGFGLEAFDALGRYRTTDVNGRPVDTSGVLTSVASGDKAFADFSALSSTLAELPEVSACMTQQLYTYAVGRAITEADSCTLQQLEADFAASGKNLLEYVVKLVSSETFFTRSN